MSALTEGAQARVATRRRHVDAVVIAEMARSLHREVGSERARLLESAESAHTRERLCDSEAGGRVRAPRVRGVRSRQCTGASIL
jgi:hypothetical protein